MTDARHDSAVIFDIDGVLVDSCHAHRQSWQQLADELDVRFTDDDFARTFGRRSPEILRECFDADANDDTIRMLDDRKEALYREIVAQDFPAMPGARELIENLTMAGFALAAGSSGPPANVELCLDRLNRRNAFHAVVTGIDVTNGKPHPEVFLTAAARLRIEPGRCAVIEDAAHGIEAANRAGMKSIGFISTGHTRDEFTEADLVIDDLRQLNATVINEALGR